MANTTVYQAFRDTAERWGDKPFVCTLPETAEIYGIPAGELSYGQALERIDALRADYAAAGYGHGHRVGILLENRPVFFLHWFALNSLGVSIVPINPDLRAAELEYLIGHSEMIMAIALPNRHQDLVEAAQRAGQPFAIMADGDMPPVVGSAAARSCFCSSMVRSFFSEILSHRRPRRKSEEIGGDGRRPEDRGRRWALSRSIPVYPLPSALRGAGFSAIL